MAATISGRLLFVLVLRSHARRRVVPVAVTAHPTAAWTAQQLREAFPWDEAPRDVLHDRDHAFDGWADTATAMGMDDLLTAPRRGRTRTSNGASAPRDASASTTSSCSMRPVCSD